MFSTIANLIRKAPARMRICCHRTLKAELLRDYKGDIKERTALEDALQSLVSTETGVPAIVGSQNIFSGDEQFQRMPHNHQRILARFYYGTRQHIEIAIKEAMCNLACWSTVAAQERADIWRKCADIIDKEDRHMVNAAIVLGQAKTYTQADEDTCRLVEALRMNADFLQQLSQIKLKSSAPDRVFPSFHMRPLDGFVAAIGPFNYTAVSASLAFCPALMGNCVVWKPSNNCVLSSYLVYQAMLKAGLPLGVISFMPCNARLFCDAVTKSPLLAGINFTGTVQNFHEIWHEVSLRITKFKTLPRLVAECSGNNFHFVHESADVNLVAEATLQAAYDYTGQKCNSCSRLYVPKSMWPSLSVALDHGVCALKIGEPCDITTFTSSVINEAAFDRIVSYLLHAQKATTIDVFSGGDFCKSLGYFVEPTVLLCRDPLDRCMTDEIMGPVLNVYVYDNEDMHKTLDLIAKTSNYAFAGSIFGSDDKVLCQALKALRMAASNVYINEKCTGSLEGQVPFGGNRLSGTNDKSGSAYFLLRWCSPQLVEESFPVQECR